MEPLAQSIVVGVSGKSENIEALRFAADEARLRGAGVTLVHAVPQSRRPLSLRTSDDSWQEAGQLILDEARGRMDAFTDRQVETTTVVRHGTAGEIFTELSGDALLIVLQHRDLSRLQRIRTGSTVTTVAAHAHCPVVSVPPRHDRPVRGVVTVGVHEDAGPLPVVETAFAEAATRGWAVHMAYAWNVASAYGDMVAQEEHWTSEAKAGIAAATEELRAKHPDVPVTIDVRHAWPADVLTELSTESDMIVVGRHSHHVPLQSRLGSLARSAIVHAECPVMIVAL
jgi:nucleotide-binding universal stress UspA family protein